MPQVSLIEQKAEELNIDIDDPFFLGHVCVCKRMLEGILGLLNSSYRTAVHKANQIEEEIQEIKIVFERISHYPAAYEYLIGSGQIESIDGIVTNVREAYGHIFAACLRKDDQDKRQVYLDVSASFDGCKDAIYQALQLINREL